MCGILKMNAVTKIDCDCRPSNLFFFIWPGLGRLYSCEVTCRSVKRKTYRITAGSATVLTVNSKSCAADTKQRPEEIATAESVTDSSTVLWCGSNWSTMFQHFFTSRLHSHAYECGV